MKIFVPYFSCDRRFTLSYRITPNCFDNPEQRPVGINKCKLQLKPMQQSTETVQLNLHEMKNNMPAAKVLSNLSKEE